MATITCKIPEALDAQLEAAAETRGVSKSHLVREALVKSLANGKSRPRPSMYDLMKDCCGIIKDAPADYATNPKYMEGFGED